MEIEVSDDTVREGVPVEIVIHNAAGHPKVHISKMGYLTPRLKDGKYTASFWAVEKGFYEISVKDSNKTVTRSIEVSSQSYLTFKEEFGAFFVLLLLVSFSLYLWMKKIRQKN